MKKTVALIYGGEGREHEISERSAKNLYAFIDRERFEVVPIFISQTGDWYIRNNLDGDFIETFPVRYKGKSGFLLFGEVMRVDAAIPILHGDFGEDGKVQGALDVAHIPYVGCGAMAGAICSDKILTKSIADYLSIPTVKWLAFTGDTSAVEAREQAEKKLSYPMFIKPSGLGSSIGAQAVNTPSEFISAFMAAAEAHDSRVLVEELADILYEQECAYLSYEKRVILSPSGRIDCNGRFYDFDLKYSTNRTANAASGILPDEKTADDMRRWARLISDFIGIRHIARIDFFITSDKGVFFNEINTMPGLTDSSLYPLMCEDMGLKKGEFINLVLEDLLYDRHI